MFAMEKPRKGSKEGHPIFSDEFKIIVAREYLTGSLSYSQLARKYQLSGEHTPRYFVRWYNKWLEGRGQQDQTVAEPATEESKDKQLEKQLFEANLKITSLELLIRNAEESLGVDIGKKDGTKQSVR